MTEPTTDFEIVTRFGRRRLDEPRAISSSHAAPPVIRVTGGSGMDRGHLAILFPLIVMDNEKTAVQEPVAEATKGPLKVFRIEDVSASVFAHAAKRTTYYSVSFSRSYKDADGRWKYIKSFGVDDLSKVVSLAEQAHDHILSLQNRENGN